MDKTGLPPTHESMEWYYRRSGMLMRSPVKLQSGWHTIGREEYPEPNCVAEAARALGVDDDRVWIALSRAELLEGKKISEWETAARIGAEAGGLDQAKLLERAQSPEIDARIRETTAEFHALQVTQRPTFVIDTPIGDRAIFSGFAKVEPMAATIDAMLEDIVGYARMPRISASRRPELVRRENALRHGSSVGYNFPSVRALLRTGRRVPRKRADLSSAPPPRGATGVASNKNDGGNLTLCRRPGDN